MQPLRQIIKWIFYLGSLLFIFLSIILAGNMVLGMAYYYAVVSPDLTGLDALPKILALSATLFIPSTYINFGRQHWFFLIAVITAALSLLGVLGLAVATYLYFSQTGAYFVVTYVLAALSYLFLFTGTILKYRGFWDPSPPPATLPPQPDPQ